MHPMRQFALLRPTELAQLAELSERHEELMRQLEASGATALPQDARELQIEVRQLRQEALKLLASVQQKIEGLS